MSLVACGINHKTTPLSLREQLAFVPEKIAAPLRDLVDRSHAREATILSTCNRTELYCETDDAYQLKSWLLQSQPHCAQILEPHIYLHQDEAAVRHIMRVASGLDSMVLGEPQILGQMKYAVALAQEVGTLGKHLQRLFQHVFSVTKRVRSETALGVNPVSVVSAALSLTKRIFANMSTTSVLLIGAGDTIELAAQYLQRLGVCRLLIANRTLQKAQQLAEKFHGEAIELSAIPANLHHADFVITATMSPLPILGKGAVESAIKRRKRRPMLIVDLAVPRDVEAEVDKLNDVYLYTIDDLQSVIAENLQERQQAAKEAETIIDLQATHFMQHLRSLNAVDTICAYRDKVTELCDRELEKALHQLQQGVAAEEVLKTMLHAVRNKLLHSPSVQLRQAAYDGQLELLEWTRQLFDL